MLGKGQHSYLNAEDDINANTDIYKWSTLSFLISPLLRKQSWGGIVNYGVMTVNR